jgi:hypothetical protein
VFLSLGCVALSGDLFRPPKAATDDPVKAWRMTTGVLVGFRVEVFKGKEG